MQVWDVLRQAAALLTSGLVLTERHLSL